MAIINKDLTEEDIFTYNIDFKKIINILSTNSYAKQFGSIIVSVKDTDLKLVANKTDLLKLVTKLFINLLLKFQNTDITVMRLWERDRFFNIALRTGIFNTQNHKTINSKLIFNLYYDDSLDSIIVTSEVYTNMLINNVSNNIENIPEQLFEKLSEVSIK